MSGHGQRRFPLWFRQVTSALVASLACALSLCCAISLGCGDSDDGVSYETELHPLFQQRCILCHYEGTGLSLIDPFDPEDGLFNVKNTWWENGHGGLENNVVPYDPEASFLMQKVTDLELVPASCESTTPPGEECVIFRAGGFMPPRPPPATDEQIAAVQQWIEEGAEDTPLFRDTVVPFFGKLPFKCSDGGYTDGCIPCFTCHYNGAPTTPNLEVPGFQGEELTTEARDAAVGEWLQSIVGVKANYRADLDLIAPRNPNDSFLLMKVKATIPSTAVGAPMPYGFEPLSESQVDTIRQWILEGARNN